MTALLAPGDVSELGRKLTAALFCLLLSAVVFERIFRAGHVTVHRISGAVAAYLLIGLVFAYVYDAIELLAPGSFHFATPALRDSALADPMVVLQLHHAHDRRLRRRDAADRRSRSRSRTSSR